MRAFLVPVRRLRYRIVTARVERMAAEKPPDSHKTAAKKTVFANRLVGIRRT
jgi:hypothetical protein